MVVMSHRALVEQVVVVELFVVLGDRPLDLRRVNPRDKVLHLTGDQESLPRRDVELQITRKGSAATSQLPARRGQLPVSYPMTHHYHTTL